MQPKHPLFQKCIAQLESLPNLKAMVKVEPFVTADVLADGQLTLHGPTDIADYVCEIKLGLTNDVIDQVIQYFQNLQSRLQDHQRPLLITQRLSNLVIDQLLAQNIEFIDVDGNLYLNSPAAYILVRPQPKRDSTSQSVELTAASLQVIYAILSTPWRAEQDFELGELEYYSHLTKIAGVSPKTVKTTLEKLQKLDYIKFRKGRYEITDYLKLLERWELGYAERLRAKLLLDTFSSVNTSTFSELEHLIKEFSTEYNYSIGGELGAAIMTRHLRPTGATLHFQEENYRKFAVTLKLKPDPKGNITLMKAFGHRKPFQPIDNEFTEKHLAHPLLIHAELVSSNDSRLKETAQMVYDRYIEDLAQHS